MIIVITGPTGSGKTSLALKTAKALNGQIINADAFQVYKGMDIGTNKLSTLEYEGIDHHLFDIKNPNENYSVADYQIDLRNKITELEEKNIPIIICGGTGLYIKAGLFDFVFEKKTGLTSTTKLNETSSEDLYAYLLSVDPISASSIHPNNRRRVLRALEIFNETGSKKSDLIAEQKHKLLYPSLFVAIDRQRSELYPLLDARVESMFEKGLIKEVTNLVKKYGEGCRSFQAIGYKQVLPFLKNLTTLEEAKAETKLATRHYVKRQMSYFRHQLPIRWFTNELEAFDFIIANTKTKE